MDFEEIFVHSKQDSIVYDPIPSNDVIATSKVGIDERSHLDDDLAIVIEDCTFPSSPTTELANTSDLDEMVVSSNTNPLVPTMVETTVP